MVLCAACKNWQHAICFGVRNQDEAPDSHICDSCANVSNKTLHKNITQVNVDILKSHALRKLLVSHDKQPRGQ